MKEYKNFHVIDHPLVKHKLTFVRDKYTCKKDFKELSSKFKNKFVVTIFSTHHGEEIFFIECFKKLEKKIHNLIFYY